MPLDEGNLTKSPNLIISAFVVTNRIEQLSDQEIHGQAKLLGTCEIPIRPMLPELLDIYGIGIRKKLEFDTYPTSMSLNKDFKSEI